MFFYCRVDAGGVMLRLLETAVALRSRWLQRPYGDQGLLIEQDLDHLSDMRPWLS